MSLESEIRNWLNDNAAREAALTKRLDQISSVATRNSERIGNLERQQHGTHSRHEDPTWAEKALHDLVSGALRRIEALERTSVKRDMARGMDYEQVHPDEMARLRRIELAARAFADNYADASKDHYSAWIGLREALKR